MPDLRLRMTKPLHELLGREAEADRDIAGVAIEGLTADSRAVKPGDLFAAMPGVKVDGSAFIADAVARGAVAVLADAGAAILEPCPVPVLRANNPRRALALVAARFYGAQPETIVAVTGTSGKTSVAEFTRQIFASAGYKAASVGTLGVVKPGAVAYGSLTTPDPITLARTLAGLAAEGITHVAMEASSHGLDQHRLEGVTLAAGAFTNLGRDHMDYHPTVEHYFDAKMRLFRELLPEGAKAVINTDEAFGQKALAVAKDRGLTAFSVGAQGEQFRLVSAEPHGFGQSLTVRAELTEGEIDYHMMELPLVGAYQADNALLAAGLAIACGQVAPDDAFAALTQLKGVPGRLDIVGEARGGLAVVDYAHKPEALAAALAAVRPFATGKLICVFGCGGDRDKGKRPIMGKISSEHADVTIVTDDNPRTEVPAVIRAEILAGATGAREIGDRAEAIRAAVAMMGPGDVVLVAGKGHETGQIVGDAVLPFSDHEVLRAALAELTK